jgi:multicomponent K+:H+ antiporter subunit E
MACSEKKSSTGIPWLPHPVLTLALLIIWLFLANTISPGHILLGGLLGIIIPWFTNRFWPERPKIIKPVRLLHFFFFTFLSDIIVANISVVKLILQPDISRLNSGFIQVPLEIKDPMVVTILASIISLTPGTVTAEVSEDQRSLIVHGLDIPDPETEIHLIKTRYEAPLKEIFSC